MKILVAYASRYGSTKQIAERLAVELATSGHDAEALPISGGVDLGGYDAFVVGSAVFYGKWMSDAEDFVRANAFTLSSRPIWLFSSGPIGPVVKDGRDQREKATPHEIAELRKLVGARDHRVFFGKLERKVVSGLGGIIARAVGVEGDFRDWGEISTWARDIAASLEGVPA